LDGNPSEGPLMAPRKPRVRISAQPHDLKAVVRLDRVTAPKQARTESLQRIPRGLETLLERKSFSDITMAEIEA
jgi:hypothetical protein